jgi:two-component system, NarL family, sensor histidine kinase DesK
VTAVRYLWIAFSLVWSVVLAIAFTRIMAEQPALGAVRVVQVVLILSLVAGLYLWLALREGLRHIADAPALLDSATLRRRLVLLLAMTALILALIVVAPQHGWWWIFQHAIIAAGLVLPPAMAVGATATLLALAIGVSWQVTGRFDSMLLIQVAFGASAIAIRQLTHTVGELHQARAELARLAVAEERLRISRDLHDLLGRSLSAIVLKSELAGKLLARSPHQASSELADIERTAREALSHVRETITGWRSPTLQGELAAARDLLVAAGIAATIDAPAAPLPQPLDRLLAWAVREGVTNVVRHSRATNCVIRVEQVGGLAHVSVTDDGPGGTDTSSIARGHGLQGLTERAVARGGRVLAGPQPDGGFRLEVEAPLAQRNAS